MMKHASVKLEILIDAYDARQRRQLQTLGVNECMKWCVEYVYDTEYMYMKTW